MSLSKEEALKYCEHIESRGGSKKARWWYMAPLGLPAVFCLPGLPIKVIKNNPVLRNTVYAALSMSVVGYGIATKVAGPPGARGVTGAIGQ